MPQDLDLLKGRDASLPKEVLPVVMKALFDTLNTLFKLLIYTKSSQFTFETA